MDTSFFQLWVVVLLAIITVILFIFLIAGILSYLKVMELKGKIDNAIGTIANPALNQSFRDTIDNIGNFIKSVPARLSGQ